MNALLVYPTHDNGREVCSDCLDQGLEAACYPGRITEATDSTTANCWNSEADLAEALGLPVVKTICPACPQRRLCLLDGYLHQLNEAQKSDVVICTHKRAEFSGIDELVKGRKYVSIHEDPIGLLRPRLTVTQADLTLALFVLERITNDPYYLDWFGTALKVDDEGNEYEDKELAIRKERLYLFCIFLHDFLRELIQVLTEAETTRSWRPADVMSRPVWIERTLFFATRRERARFTEPAWRFILTAAIGELTTSAIIVDRRHAKGTREPVDVRKTVIGIRDNRPPPTSTVWFNDATASHCQLEQILQHQVDDRTPCGHLPLQKKAVQLLRDVTRGTSRKTVCNLIRGVLADRQQFQSVGIIGHRPHLKAIPLLGARYTDRIVKETYFGSGDERSSNDWHHQCDLILVVGTPRIPPSAIAEYLVQVGDLDAACRAGDWDTLYWHGVTESSEPREVIARGYRDPAWRAAQHDLVRAQIVQAIGRGRGVLEDGCEVLVLSNEECGLVLSDVPVQPLNKTDHKILEILFGATIQNPNKYILGKRIVSTAEIAQLTGLKESYLRKRLQALERRGLVHKSGERKGWLPVSFVAPVVPSESEVV